MAAISCVVSALSFTAALRRLGRVRVIFAVYSPTPKPPVPVWCRQSSSSGCSGSALATTTSVSPMVTPLKFQMSAHTSRDTRFRKKVTLLLSAVLVTV